MARVILVVLVVGMVYGLGVCRVAQAAPLLDVAWSGRWQCSDTGLSGGACSRRMATLAGLLLDSIEEGYDAAGVLQRGAFVPVHVWSAQRSADSAAPVVASTLVEFPLPHDHSEGTSTTSRSVFLMETFFSNHTGHAVAWSHVASGTTRTDDTTATCLQPSEIGLGVAVAVDPRVHASDAQGTIVMLPTVAWTEAGNSQLSGATASVSDAQFVWAFAQGKPEPAPSLPPSCAHRAIQVEYTFDTAADDLAPWVVDALFPSAAALHTKAQQGSYHPVELDNSDKCVCNGDPLEDLPAPWWLVIVAVAGLALGCVGGFFVGYARHKKEAKRSLQYEPLVNLI